MLTHAERRERRDKIAQQVADGVPIGRLARKHGLSEQSIRSYARTLGQQTKCATIGEYMNVISLTQKGKTTEEIAKKMGRSVTWVRKVLGEAKKKKVILKIRRLRK